MTRTNQFSRYAQLGYTRLVPVIPPDAPISERSSLHKRLGTSQDARGKTPGVKGRDGKWFSFDWTPYEADERDYERWHAMNAGVGIKTGNGLIAIDADTMSEQHAATIRDVVQRIGGLTPIRVGRYPKALYLARVTDPIQYQRIEFGERDDRGIAERVEILSDGRFFVAEGTHPKTGQPYTWPKPIVPFNDLPLLQPHQVVSILEELRGVLPEASKLIKEGGVSSVDQHTLKGPAELVRKAVEAIPNSSAYYPSRESYRDMGYAIKAALPDDPYEAFTLFSEWCDRWDDGDNDPGVVEADWSRMKPPFRRGAQWLYEQAEEHGKGFNIGEVWLENLDQPDNPFQAIELNSQKSEQGSDTFDVLSLDDLENRPPAEWLVARHIPKKSVGFLYSTPGAGKTFITLDVALHLADGRADWHGDPLKMPDEGGTVLYIASEGSYGFRNRVAAWKRKNGHSENLSKRFKMIEQTINFMNADDIGKLLRTVRAIQAGGAKLVLVVVDTVSRAMPGADENLQKDMTLFVRACDAVRDATGGAVVGVHHAGKAGDMRGSTVLLGAGDFVFRLERKKGATVGTLACEKQKDGPDGWEEPYRFDLVNLEAGETSLTVERAEMGVGPDVALTPDVTGQVLRAMKAAWEAGEPWAKAPQAGERYAPRRMVAEFGFNALAAEETLGIWEASGLIWVAVASSSSKRKGYQVGEIPGHAVQSEGIFA